MTKNILIIEDTPMHLTKLSDLLSEYELRVATSGSKGIELANKHKFDLILLDILMPDMSGYEVLKHLKQNHVTKEIPVILITSMDSTEAEYIGLEAGAIDFIKKPFSDQIVMSRIKIHLKRA